MPPVNGFSIVVCCYNSVNRLAPTLSHLAALQIPADFAIELLIIDNASTDHTADFALQQWQKLGAPYQIKVCSETTPGLSAARAKGFQCASYAFILMCDDDNWLQSDYLLQAAPVLADPAIGGLGGFGIPNADTPFPDWFPQFSKSFALGAQGTATGPVPKKRSYLYGAGCILRKSAIDYVYKNGFQSRLQDRKGKSYSSGGDVELCYALVLAGYTLWYCDKMQFKHYLPENRLQWEDFVKLKTGITKSYGTFLTYMFFIKKNKTGRLFFLHYYFRQIQQKISCIIGQSLNKRKDKADMKGHQMELTICTLQLKILLFSPLSLWKNYQYVSSFKAAVKP